MSQSSDGDITRLLHKIHTGKNEAWEDLLSKVYEQLLLAARRVLSGQPLGQSLHGTALVNEAWLKIQNRQAPFHDHRHFFGFAVQTMRSVVIDHARRRNRREAKAGPVVPLDKVIATCDEIGLDLEALEEALGRLSSFDPIGTQIIVLRFHFGFTMDEVATALGKPKRSIERHWQTVRAWLHKEIGTPENEDEN